jgi:subtilisin family serine protease
VLLASLTLITPAGASLPGPAAVGDVPSGPATPSRTVTLITGDRVTVTGTTTAVVHRGPGRDHIAFLTRRMDDHLYVIPGDAVDLLQEGHLDRRLFNVTLLQEFGYHDGRPDLPLIVVAGDPPATFSMAAGGGEVMRDLPAVGGVAVQVGKVGIGGFWDGLVGAAGVATASPVIWLDGLRQPLLDQSVPQVGAPAAWAKGLDGSGVTVAVLDTGIDGGHLDLADRVVASENFTEGFEEDGDLVGHGTHVASIIAGSGAASGGQYQGVAPGARLLDGKVCVVFGCAESWILAGMQWAVEQGASVVNLSLGGPDVPELDPLEQAVETLTAEHGVLFVISAGNDGSDGSINSPASADSALAVGAVEQDDTLAWFSSRGPRADGALKPDLTAPGVEIVAANSAEGFLGAPGEPYTTLSGTSMSAPHVAGAAAVLAQQHPGRSPAELKAVLMGSASPQPGSGPYAQGAGRLDLARVIGQRVITDPPSVSFDRTHWPHHDDQPQTRTVTYLNHGSADVTLMLELTTTGADGGTAPEGFFQLSDTSVTVPAGGSADVGITADTSVGELDGPSGGHLIATGPDVAVTTPFAVDREVESYDLTLVHTDRAGEPTSAYFTTLVRVDDFGIVDVFGSDTATVRLPAGEYALVSVLFGVDEELGFRTTLLAQPQLVVGSDQVVAVDARVGQPVSVRVPERDAGTIMASISADLVTDQLGASFTLISDGFDGLFSGQLGPDQVVEGFASTVRGTWVRSGLEGDITATPYIYDLGWFTVGRMATGFLRDVRRGDLARIRADHAVDVPGGSALKWSFPLLPGVVDGGVAVAFPTELPFMRIEYHNTDGGVQWLKSFEEAVGEDEFGFPGTVTVADSAPTRYQAGRTYHEEWNYAVFGPVLPETRNPWDVPVVFRDGDLLSIFPRLYGDAAGRIQFLFEPADVTIIVFRDGALLVEDPSPFLQVEVPPEPADYRVEIHASRGERFPLSTRTSLAWTFRSGHVDGEPEVLPVSVLRFTPGLDAHNAAPAGRSYLVPMAIVPQPGSVNGGLTGLTVDVSYDDGQTWRQVPVLGGRMVLLRHPAADGFVSLRARATEADGNSVEQTIIRAYRITASS